MNEFMSYIVTIIALGGFFLTILALMFMIFIWPTIADRFGQKSND